MWAEMEVLNKKFAALKKECLPLRPSMTNACLGQRTKRRILSLKDLDDTLREHMANI
jgi:hypothetical protein